MSDLIIHTPTLAPVAPGSFKVVVAFPAAMLVERDDLLERSQAVERVIGETSQKSAFAILDEIQQTLKKTEALRKDTKQPFAAVGKKIDEVASAFVELLESEKARLKAALGSYQAELARQEAERQKELQRLVREREQAAAEAARQAQLAAEGDAKAANALAQAQEKILETEMKAVEHLSAPVAAKPAGMSVRKRYVANVVDIRKLYAVFGTQYVKLEPKMREINAALAQMAAAQPDQMPTLPGCIVTEEVDVSTR